MASFHYFCQHFLSLKPSQNYLNSAIWLCDTTGRLFSGSLSYIPYLIFIILQCNIIELTSRSENVAYNTTFDV